MNELRRPSWVEIRIRGHLDRRWSDWFEGLAITYPADDETRLLGPVRDQAALHGLLARIRDLGLTLLSVQVLEERESQGASYTNPPHQRGVSMTEQDQRPPGPAEPNAGPERPGKERSRLEPPRTYAWIASLATLAVIVTAQLVTRGDNAVLRLVGVGALALAAVFIFPPFLRLARHGRRDAGDSYLQTRGLVDRGLYAVVRHPQYLGYILLATGFALLSQHAATLCLGAVAVISFILQALAEEHYCLAQLGEPYRRYLHRVPRFNVLLGIVRLLARPDQNDLGPGPPDRGHRRTPGRSTIESESEKE